MSKGMIFYMLMLCVIYGNMAVGPAVGAVSMDVMDGRPNPNYIGANPNYIGTGSKNPRGFIANEESNPLPQTEETEEIEKELKRLMEDVKRLEKVIEKRIKKDVLPHIRREIEKLRKWLREFQPVDDNPSPQNTRKDDRDFPGDQIPNSRLIMFPF